MIRMPAAEPHRLIAALHPRTERETAMRQDFLSFFSPDGGPVLRESGPDHLTASCVVFDAALERTLLVFHRKGGFWVQPGGHIEPEDTGVVEAALRELREETGVRATVPDPLVYDLDHHALSASFGRCASHLDIAIAAIADPDAALTVSDESEDVRWWPLDALPDEVPRQLDARLRGLLARLRRSD